MKYISAIGWLKDISHLPAQPPLTNFEHRNGIRLVLEWYISSSHFLFLTKLVSLGWREKRSMWQWCMQSWYCDKQRLQTHHAESCQTSAHVNYITGLFVGWVVYWNYTRELNLHLRTLLCFLHFKLFMLLYLAIRFHLEGKQSCPNSCQYSHAI